VTAIGITAPALFFLKNGIIRFIGADLNPVVVWKMSGGQFVCQQPRQPPILLHRLIRF
jgi:hypothetical protein